MEKLTRFMPVALLAMALIWTGCDDDDNGVTEPDPEPTIVEVAQDGGFSTLVAAVEAADLVSTLESDGPFTVFAPTDAAFDALPEGTVASLLEPENKDQLTSILTYHVVSGRVPASDVVSLTSAKTVEGSDVAISVDNGTVRINGATVVQTDIEASNGIIHVIDSVLLPPSAASKKGRAAGQQSDTIADIATVVNAETGEFSILLEALTRTGLVSAVAERRQKTVFAPTDAAFVDLLGELGAASLGDIDDATLEAVLLYHVVPGRQFANSVLRKKQLKTLNGGFISVDGANVSLIDNNDRTVGIIAQEGFFDIPASNGVIHAIDRVLLP